MIDRLHRIARIIGCLATALLACAPAMAQNNPDIPGARVLREEAETATRGPVTVTLRAGGEAIFQTDFKSKNASIASYFARSGVDVSWKAAKTLQLNFGLAYEAGFYEIDNGKNVFPSLDEDNPFDTLQSVALAVSGQWYVSDPWYVLGAGLVTAGWESGADFSEAWTYGGFGGVGYKFSDRFTMALGAGFSTRLEEDPTFYPFISLRWQATDSLLLETQGLGLRLTSTINDHLAVYLNGGYASRDFRLADSGSEPDAALEDRAVAIGAGLKWTPIANLELSVEGGAIVYRELQLWDAGGDRLSKEETDIAPYIGLKLRYFF